MIIYYSIDDRTKTTRNNNYFDLLVGFFDTEIAGSSKSWRRWLTEDYESANGNMYRLIKENENLHLLLQDCFYKDFQHDLFITQRNFIELLDTWDDLAIKKKIRELIFEEKNGYYTMQPY